MVYRSKYPDVAVVDELIHERVLGRAAERGSTPAMVDTVRKLAAGLAADGIGKGDVVALHSPNSSLFPVVLFATTTAGATVTRLSPLATPEDVAKQLVDSKDEDDGDRLATAGAGPCDGRAREGADRCRPGGPRLRPGRGASLRHGAPE